MNHDDFIGIYDNVLSIDVCADTIHWYEQNVSNEGMREKRKVDQGYIDMLTITKPQRVPSFNNLHRSIVHNLNEAYIEYTNTFLHCNQDIDTFVTAYKIQRTQEGEGYHTWHPEHGPNASKGRYLVWMIYLNNTIGGETEFFHQNKSITPKQGRCVIWPAAWTHTHRANDNLKSRKYILTGWWDFDYGKK